MDTRKYVQIGISAIVLLILVVGVLQFMGGQISDETLPITASVFIDFGNGTSLSFTNITTCNATVFGLLLEAAKMGNFSVKYTYYGEYDSMFVDSIAGVENGKDNRWWQYYVNGEYGMVGADKKPVKDGDIIEWKFEESQW
ncbi:MAG TPA: DUF4430 domain-containing protein [Thermoplasmatales archaeon]|nr:DUF4430 domain-containing protein [Thermoplasmatales archaeon]